MLSPESSASNGAESTTEHQRLSSGTTRLANWKCWGPYLSDRQWATVREDYSKTGQAWEYFPHEHARKRAYRWGEDGIMGFCDFQCRLCFAVTVWNGKDKILKERYFGLTGTEGNHGEDVKELYYYLDSTPTHSYCKGLYKYPMAAFPYEELVSRNAAASKTEAEIELLDTGVFEKREYFDVQVEYAKDHPDSMLVRLTISNRSDSTEGDIHVLPTVWFRNTWSWGHTGEGSTDKPALWWDDAEKMIKFDHETMEKDWQFTAEREPKEWLFTENETNYGACGFMPPSEQEQPFTKDAFHRYVIEGEEGAVNGELRGTKAAPHYELKIAPGKSETLCFRLKRAVKGSSEYGQPFEETFQKRVEEADTFYEKIIPSNLDEDEKLVSRQAYAGLLWTKQFYHYVVREWVIGDPLTGPNPDRTYTRNGDWMHFHARDVISMPDKWEYPWFAVWDLAFHMVAYVFVDPDFAKEQLLLFLREWYMHPSGMMPAYEWDFNSVNPPVHAWACWNVYRLTGATDKLFLERVFTKLIINFTWWVNQKDKNGSNIFTGGFLGLDNISIFDRNEVPGGLQQADATSWMAFFCAYMLTMALELAQTNPAMEDIASKFFEHFVGIIAAINEFEGNGLWDDQDGFFYDWYERDGSRSPLRIRSVAGLIPLAATCLLPKKTIAELPGFKRRMDWFIEQRPWLSKHIESNDERFCLSVVNSDKLRRILRYVADPNEFLSPYGIRSLSRFHKDNPFTLDNLDPVTYLPGESDSGMFGGNSNWRGPIWFPVNSIIIEAIRKYYDFFGPDLTVEYPLGSGAHCSLHDIAEDLAVRTSYLFLRRNEEDDPEGHDNLEKVPHGARPCHGANSLYMTDPHFKDLILFYEYFNGDTGLGLGAAHQTGWTGLVALHLHQIGNFVRDHPDRFKWPSKKDSMIRRRESSLGLMKSLEIPRFSKWEDISE